MSTNITSTVAKMASDMFSYDASLPMAWIGGVVFSLTALFHVFQYFKNRSFYLYLFMIGVFMEVASYWCRVVAIKNPNNGAASSMTYLLSTIAPSYLAAACYMTFGRIIYLVTPENRRAVKHTWVPIRFTTIIFVSCDFASFFVQCIGIFVMIGNVTNKTLNEQQRSTGATMTYNILRVGFILQIVAFFAFLVVAFRFMFASKSWRYDWPNGGSGNWRKIAWAVVIASALVTVRSLFRCLMFTVNGGNNYAQSHEWMFYMFDMVPILAILILFNVIHPGSHIPSEYTTIKHGYKKPGFRPAPMLKEAEAEPTAGYSRVTLVPPPLAPPTSDAPQMRQAPGSTMNFSDPWNNRPSPGAERY